MLTSLSFSIYFLFYILIIWHYWVFLSLGHSVWECHSWAGTQEGLGYESRKQEICISSPSDCQWDTQLARMDGGCVEVFMTWLYLCQTFEAQFQSLQWFLRMFLWASSEICRRTWEEGMKILSEKTWFCCHWLSRFGIWFPVSQFAKDSKNEGEQLLAEHGRRNWWKDQRGRRAW